MYNLLKFLSHAYLQDQIDSARSLLGSDWIAILTSDWEWGYPEGSDTNEDHQLGMGIKDVGSFGRHLLI